MNSNSKRLSNPFSTGGGGAHFEAHVQASFVALMLTGGHAPCIPCWPIKEIWDRATRWLGDAQGECWSITKANPYQADGNLDVPIDKLIEY